MTDIKREVKEEQGETKDERNCADREEAWARRIRIVMEQHIAEYHTCPHCGKGKG